MSVSHPDQLRQFGCQQELGGVLRLRDLLAYGVVFMAPTAPMAIFGAVFSASGGMVVHGTLLALGDGHARQGDGEVCGMVVETAMRTTLTIDLIKDVHTPWPRVETDTQIMSVGCARPLEDAYRISQHDLVGWVCQLSGPDLLDAYQPVAQAGTAAVGNVCDPIHTMLAAIDQTYVGDTAVVHGGVHDRLCAAPRSGWERR